MNVYSPLSYFIAVKLKTRLSDHSIISAPHDDDDDDASASLFETVSMEASLSTCCWSYRCAAASFFSLPLPAAELETSPPVSRLMNAAAQAASSFMYPSMCSLDHILERRGENVCISGSKRIWGMMFFIISAHTSQ